MNEDKITYYNSLTYEQAHALPKEEVIIALDEDKLYYGAFGQNWLSNSHLTKLFDDPHLLKEDEVWGNGQYLVIGNFVHKAILEPHKVESFPYSTATNRHQTHYKEDLAESEFEHWMFLEKDYRQWITFADEILKNDEVKAILHHPDNEYEVPQVAMFNGVYIKGKCDIINHKKKQIIDLKTTSNLPEFDTKVDEWNYNVQAYLYAKALYPDYSFRFVAVDKRTNQSGVFDVSIAQFYKGEKKLYQAINLWKQHHTEGPKVFYHTI